MDPLNSVFLSVTGDFGEPSSHLSRISKETVEFCVRGCTCPAVLRSSSVFVIDGKFSVALSADSLSFLQDYITLL